MKKHNANVNRTDRINSELKKEIYEIITRKLKNPLVTEMVSVTDVVCSRDLGYAKVYISVYSKSEEKKEKTLNAIVGDAKKIRYELAHSMKIRTVPELEFVVDSSLEYGDKMDKLLNSIKKEENS